MSPVVLKNGCCVIGDRLVSAHIVIENGIIRRVIDSSYNESLPDACSVIDCTGMIIGPGFIDVHVHGGGGGDVMDASTYSFQKIARLHGRNGTTRFLPTTITADHDALVRVCQAYQSWEAEVHSESKIDGALPLGLHLEGPYIAAEKKGAQNGAHIRPFDWKEMETYQRASGGRICWITLAPELLSDLNIIHQLRAHDIVVSIGHTNATYEQVHEAVQYGANHFTHLCNAMPGIHHRSPGPVTYALNHDHVSIEWIADGIHVHPSLMQLSLRAKQVEDICIVTDATRPTGIGDGEYELGGLPVTVQNNVARLADGSLAGSLLNMSHAYHVIEEHVTQDPCTIFQMMSTTPARLLGVEDRFGSLHPGKVADLVCMVDGRTEHVMINGQWITHPPGSNHYES